MGDPMRIRATEKNGEVNVKILMRHDMETGLRKNSNGVLIPEHHITDIMIKNNDQVVLKSHFGPSISKNPYLNFKYKGGAKGDTLTVIWEDNTGDTRTDETLIK